MGRNGGRPKNVGSSPHTRGAPGSPGRRQVGCRIIPAYAGSTPRSEPGCRPPWDHPRIRGEHSHAGTCSYGIGGSSPHTRGARHLPGKSPGSPRIIPAYAGSTTPSWKVTGKPADHPRIRGEHVGLAWEGVKMVGSSPHTRGALHIGPPALAGVRIIPAYAGSTASDAQMEAFSADHPRIRGEHSSWSILAS